MPIYDYKCEEHGYFEQKNSMADRAKGVCPTCKSAAKQVILGAPKPLIEAMADAGCPGAFETSGNRMTKRHKEAGQYDNSPSQYWRD
jgi:putative FmdB family regulatory protein